MTKSPASIGRDWNAVFDLLSSIGGAPESMREDFVFHLSSEGPPDEYRFQGNLGFGGKYWRKPNHVSCYVEDTTPERRETISYLNAQLAKLKARESTPDKEIP